MQKYTTHFVIALLAGLIVYSAYQGIQQRRRGVGEAAPSFDIPYLDRQGTDGPQNHQGSVVVIDFWSSFCGPCIEAMDTFQRIHERYGFEDDLTLLSVNVDPEIEEGDRESVVRAFKQRFGLTFPILMDTGYASHVYGVGSIPHVVVIDRSGSIQTVHVGSISEGELLRDIQSALEEPNS